MKRNALYTLLFILLQGVAVYGSEQAVGIQPPAIEVGSANHELFSLLQEQNLPRIKSLLAQGMSTDTKDEQGRTLLYRATELYYLPALEFLLESGADTELTTPSGYTPLHAACENGQTDCVELLVKGGANINAIDLKKQLLFIKQQRKRD